MQNIQILRGNILFTTKPEEFTQYPLSYIIVQNGVVEGIYSNLPDKYSGIEIQDFGERFIIPGLVDLHVHAPQFDQMGLGLDLELIDWLNTYTFPLESRFQDLSYAKEVYSCFAEELVRQGTTRACIYATIHKESTELLMELLIQKGVGAFVGKVNMDRNGAAGLQEDTKQSIQDTRAWIEKVSHHPLVKPILTPRFAPTCSNELLTELGQMAKQYNIPVQSHLSENKAEVQWVRQLFPQCASYSDVYHQFGLFGQTPTLMAHGIYLTENELELIQKNQVIIVHCPDSNLNLASGLMPARRWMNKKISIGLGSDVAGGHRLSMTRAMVSAIQTSKAVQSMTGEKALTIPEVFYMATKGGGSFFGKVGSFEKGYEFDALVIEDEDWTVQRLSLEERLQRWIYSGDAKNIVHRFVNGKLIINNNKS